MLAVLGAGRMGEAIASGSVSAGALQADRVVLADVDRDRLGDLASQYGFVAADSNSSAAAQARYVLLSVKPQHVSEVLTEVAPVLKPSQTLVSIAAGVPLLRLRAESGLHSAVRAMPNMPAMVGQGMSAVCYSPEVRDEDKLFVGGLFKSVGGAVEISEEDIDKVTAVSGSGPAYFFALVEALTAGAVGIGIERRLAEQLAEQTFVGSARLMAETGMSPAELIGAVASRGGTTEAAMSVLGPGLERGLREALEMALARAAELAGEGVS